MLRLSALAESVKPSATLAAGAKAKEMKAAGIKVYDFTLGEPDFPTPAYIRAAAQEAMNAGHTKYTAAEGLPALRQAVAKCYLERTGLQYGMDQVLISNGAKHSLHNALSTLVGPGDEVIIPSPYWTSYADLVGMTGASLKLVPTSAEQGFKLTPAQLQQAISSKSKVLLMNSPCNPTGVTYTSEELTSLARVVTEKKIAVISDEIYEHLTYDDIKPTCMATLLPEMKDCTIVISGGSKSYAMTGWRIGWAVGPRQVIQAMGNIQSQQTGCPNSISQHAALVALTSDQKSVAEMRKEFQARRDLIYKGLASLPGITVLLATGAFYAFFNITQHLGRTLHGIKIENSADFCRAALEKVQVSVVPGSAFGAEGYVRLSFASSREDLQGGVEQLRKLLT
ncbi:MAG TPA: pyridoxal phosphate-dependent aminotransferase [Gemmatales bacterium]|nr:pyridoxal phosphate-dependent aminotransferase [Gemmatales bacterium]